LNCVPLEDPVKVFGRIIKCLLRIGTVDAELTPIFKKMVVAVVNFLGDFTLFVLRLTFDSFGHILTSDRLDSVKLNELPIVKVVQLRGSISLRFGGRNSERQNTPHNI
jgi:hypothetical protein